MNYCILILCGGFGAMIFAAARAAHPKMPLPPELHPDFHHGGTEARRQGTESGDVAAWQPLCSHAATRTVRTKQIRRLQVTMQSESTPRLRASAVNPIRRPLVTLNPKLLRA